MPGKGTIYVGQQISFLRPIVVGQLVRAKAEIKCFNEKKPWIATISTKAFIVHPPKENTLNEREFLAIDGEATVMLPWLKPKST